MSNFYRVSTANLFDNSLRNINARQTSLSNQQENLTSGKRVVRPSDDPVAAAQAERALTRIARIQADQRALDNQRGTISQAESTLGQATDLVQELRELVVGAGGGSLTNADRKTYAEKINSVREQLSTVVNKKDVNGMPLLGALGSALEPFVGPLSSTPDYRFAGQPGQAASTGSEIATSLDGHAAFMFDPVRDGIYTASITRGDSSSTLVTSAIQTSNQSTLDGAQYALKIDSVTPDTTSGTTTIGYTLTKTDADGTVSTTTGNTSSAATGQPVPISISEGSTEVMSFTLSGTPAAGDTVTIAPSTSIFSSIDDAVRGITKATSSVEAAQTVAQALSGIDAGLQRIQAMRGYAGELLNRADRITGDNESRSVQLEADRSRAEDLDMTKGISQFQNSQVGYQAALQSYAMVQKLSLFNFIS